MAPVTQPNINTVLPRLWWILLGWAGCYLMAQQQTPSNRGVTHATPPEVLQKANFNPEESRGFFVGINQFQDQTWAAIPYAADDAVDLAYLFSQELKLVPAAHLTLAIEGTPVKEPTRAKLEELKKKGATLHGVRQSDFLRELRRLSKDCGANGLFVVTVATHGFSKEGASYLVASDTLKMDMDLTGVPLIRVTQTIQEANAPRQILLTDACREKMSGNIRGSGASAPMSEAFRDAISRADGLVSLSGTTLGGFSYDDPNYQNGVFSHAVMEGLRGMAPADENQYITARSLAGFVEQRVSAWVKQNRPEHRHLSKGIERTLSGRAADLPLAVNTEQLRQSYTQRRETALDHLRANLGQLITGSVYDQVAQALPTDFPKATSKALLSEIATLDGSAQSQKSFLYWLEKDWPALQPKASSTTESRGTSRSLTPAEPPGLDKQLTRRKALVLGGSQSICDALTVLGMEVTCDLDARFRSSHRELVIWCGTIPHQAGSYLLRELGLHGYSLRTHQGDQTKMKMDECGKFYEITIRN